MTVRVGRTSRVGTAVLRLRYSAELLEPLLGALAGLVGDVGVWMQTLRHAATRFSWSLLDTVCEVERERVCCVVFTEEGVQDELNGPRHSKQSIYTGMTLRRQ